MLKGRVFADVKYITSDLSCEEYDEPKKAVLFKNGSCIIDNHYNDGSALILGAVPTKHQDMVEWTGYIKDSYEFEQVYEATVQYLRLHGVILKINTNKKYIKEYMNKDKLTKETIKEIAIKYGIIIPNIDDGIVIDEKGALYFQRGYCTYPLNIVLY